MWPGRSPLMLSRRAALAGGSVAGLTLAGSAAAQSSAILIRTDEKPVKASGAEHFVVYRNEREFAGWPHYCGLWQTADGSIVAGFKRVPSDYGNEAAVDHRNVTNAMGEIVVIRSTDGGRSWDRNSITPVFDMSIKTEKDLPGGK